MIARVALLRIGEVGRELAAVRRGNQLFLEREGELRQVVELAQKVLPSEQVDANRYNFVFDKSGKPLGWVDWVISRVPAELSAP